VTVPVFIDVATAAARLADSEARLRPLEVRRGDEDVEQHLPGAVVATLPDDLSRADAPATQGKRPLPDISSLQRTLQRWGVTEQDHILVYEDAPSFAAARAWWVLRWAGLARVSILDGGLPAWLRAGHPTGPLAAELPASDITLSAGHLEQLDADTAATLAARGHLIDARSADAFEAGHIPGARNVSSAATLTSAGTLRDADSLRALYDVGSRPGLYCGGGVAASHGVAVLAHLGVSAPLFVGSFSAWSADPARPVATGRDSR
jgi:thiosulfate/3-mercaptopyruvate sulfurtransferase